MDNGTLVFIIIIQAIVIAWMASKLKQYEKVAKLLNFAETPESRASTSPASAQRVTAASQHISDVTSSTSQDASGGPQGVASVTSARSASRAVADSMSAEGEEEILDMPGVDPEGNIEEAKRVQLVMARCRYAEFYLEQLDDDYERGQFQRIISSCKNTALSIEDPFFKSSALHAVIMLLDRAEWESDRDKLLAEVDDELVREQITQALSADAVT